MGYLHEPRVIGRYAVFDEVAAGGMAAVHLGRLLAEGGFSRTVAIKRLHPQFARDPDFVTMFLDEARLASRIRHPNVVTTLDVVAEGDEVLLVMEYIAGESLSKLERATRPTPVPVGIAVAIMTAVLHGLHAAHEAKTEQGHALDLVHRDVSPQNILVGTDGVARVLDFGVAKASHRAQTTKEGQLKGKLSYMAPEQLRRDAIDRRSDIYAASVVLWECLTGERLFEAHSEAKVVMNILTKEVPPPSSIVKGLPPSLDAVVLKGLAREPSERYQTAREMAIALERCEVAHAPSSQIGECVEALASSSLSTRAARVTDIERISDQALASSATLRAALQSAATLPQPIEAEPVPSSAAYSTSATLPGRSSRPRRVLLAGLAMVLVLGVVGFVVATKDQRAPLAPVATAPAKVDEAPPASTAASATPPSPQSTSTATTVATASSPMAPSSDPPRKAATPTPAIVPRKAAPPPPPPAKTDACKPPYTVDSSGIRHLKPECL